MNSWPTRGHPLLFAHRGASAELPENTLPAYRRALACGADVLEMDVHLTRDQHVVVSHDPSGMRAAGVDSEIRQSTLAQVTSWDAGFGFCDANGKRPFAGKGYQIPTLEEVLSEFSDQLINVDIKQSTPDMVEPLLALVERQNAAGRVLITSFFARPLRKARRMGYTGPTGMSRAEVARAILIPRMLQRLVPPRGCRVQIPVRYGVFRLASRDGIERLHNLGLAVDYWVVNSVHHASELLELGADGIVTDDPAAIAQVFAVAPSAAAWRQRHA